MICYIKDFKTFENLAKFDSTEYNFVYATNDVGNVTVYKKDAIELTTKYAGMWLIADGHIFYISEVKPSGDTLEFSILPPMYAFSRQVETVNYNKYGPYIANILVLNFGAECPDSEYKMSYLSVIGRPADNTIQCKIETDDYGYVIPYEVMEKAIKDGVKIDFSFTNSALTIRITDANYETGVVVFNDGSTVINEESYDPNFIAKATVIHSLGRDPDTEEELYEVIDYYLSADNTISTTPPVNRAKGIWKYYTADEDTNPLSVATGAFSHNNDNHKIEFYSPKEFNIYQPIKMRLRNEVFNTIITYISKSSSDNRYYYKCGNLATTLTEKIDAENKESNETVKIIKNKVSSLEEQTFDILSIPRGGTGGATVPEVLNNLGIADKIVERGTIPITGTGITSGNWFYKKYSSRKFEAWGVEVITSLASRGTLNGWNWTTTYIIPPSFAASIESSNANAKWGTGISWANIRSSSVSSLEVVVFSNQSDNQAYVWFQIWGTY